jgi:hypothetical protein
MNMEPILCANCFEFFPPSSRHKDQTHCMKSACRRAKKVVWKRNKMDTDPKFKEEQKLINKKWAQNHPGYWKEYRKKNPKKAERNRALQTLRNRRRVAKRKNKANDKTKVIAKVDTSISNNFALLGRFWVIPVIAKVDALKVNIYEISRPYQ